LMFCLPICSIISERRDNHRSLMVMNGKMKKILLACGTGIVTSTAVNQKLTKVLNERGYARKFSITQCKIVEAASKSGEYDFVVATTLAPPGLKCPYVSGIPFLTGINVEPTILKIIELLEAQ